VAKGPDAFRTISEAADELNVPQHVLRFWETRFSFIRPMKRAGGRRFYRPQDIEVLRGVKSLLHEDGYTIKGVQKLHKDEGLKGLLAAKGRPAEARTPAAQPARAAGDRRAELKVALRDLLAAKARLDQLLQS
jgi:DNA-binding transcriptional MerR regulator